MKLKARINQKDITSVAVQGNTTSTEFNETLDGASLILSNSEKLDILPYDDLFLYEGDFIPAIRQTKEIKIDSTINEYEKDYGYTPFESLASQITIGQGGNIILLQGEVLRKWNNFFYNYTQEQEDNNLIDILYGSKSDSGANIGGLKFGARIRTIVDGVETLITEVFSTAIKHASNRNQNVIYFVSRNGYLLVANIRKDSDMISFAKIQTNQMGRRNDYEILQTEITDFGKRELITTKRNALLVDYNIHDRLNVGNNFGWNVKLLCVIEKDNGEITSTEYDYNNIVFPTQKNGITLKNNNAEENIVLSLRNIMDKDVFYNESIDFLNSNIIVGIKSKTWSVIKFEKTITPSSVVRENFYQHYLVENIIEEKLNNNNEKSYKYTLDLMSETKGLEKVVLPNTSITQPLIKNKKKSIWQLLNKFIDLYSPLRKFAIEGTNNKWEYLPKYILDDKVEDIFKDVYSPDFSFATPTLRDVLNQLMLVKNCIPYVEDNIIKAKDISKAVGIFDMSKGDIQSAKKVYEGASYTQNLSKQYENAISQDNSARSIELIGFRNSDTGVLKLEDYRLETRFPIYKINKIYIRYYKKITLMKKESNGTNVSETKRVLIKQDITPLVVLENDRNLLRQDWREFHDENTRPNDINEFAKYKFATVGYQMGSNLISGWGQTYSFKTGFGNWFDRTFSYLENIMNLIDNWSPFGVNVFQLIKDNPNDYLFNYGAWNDKTNPAMMSYNGGKDIGDLLASFVFEIDYNAMYSGKIIHSKDKKIGEFESVDTSSQPLTILESDGIFEKEKVNRVGNAVHIITANYKSIDQVQNVGTIIKERDNAIVYKRELTLYANGILAIYYASEDYVLKNYYTSIWSKHRTYNLMSYNESVRRSENYKRMFLISQDNLYYENNNKIRYSNFGTNQNIISKLFTAFLPSPMPTSQDKFENEDAINQGLFVFNNKKYITDINAFVSGNSFCMNINMYDNVSSGISLNGNRDSNIEGLRQEWNLAVDDIETGQIAKMSLRFAYNQKNNSFDEDVRNVDVESIKKIYKEKLFKLPFYTDVYIRENYGSKLALNNIIELNNIAIEKDNKELLDFTLQYEIINDNDNVYFSSWLVKLSDLANDFLKWNNTFSVKDTSLTRYEMQSKYSSYQVNRNDYWVFFLLYSKIEDESTYLVKDMNIISMPLTFTQNNGDMLMMSPKLIVGINQYLPNTAPMNNQITKTITVRFECTFYNASEQKNYTRDLDYLLAKRGDSSNGYNYYSLVDFSNLANENADIQWLPIEMRKTKTSDIVSQVMDYEYSGVSDLRTDRLRGETMDFYSNWNMNDVINGTNDYNSIGLQLNLFDDSETSTITYNKNMFVFYGNKHFDKDIAMQEFNYDDMNKFLQDNELMQSDKQAQAIFKVSKQNEGYTSLKVYNRLARPIWEITPPKLTSIQFWYLDERTNLMHLVFGLNLDTINEIQNENTNDYHYEYFISDLTANRLDVFNDGGEKIGKIKNLKNDKANYGENIYENDI